MLISSTMSHRHCNALALRSRSLCPLMRSSPRPCQFKPNAWWMVSPFKSLAITACSVTTWNSAPCFHPKIRRPRPLPRQGRRLGPPEVWNLALGSQAKAHAIKATPLSATCPSHLHAPAELLHLHAPAICFSGRSRLPFARPQTLQTLPQASKATTLTATTCPCHLFFRGFKTAVCPPSNPPNASNPSAGLQGNNSYSYMPLPSVFQGVQDCRLPALKPPKRFRRPPRQQLLQLLHAPAICFSGGSRLPFARPPPNASNPPAGLQGNNSYSYYMPLPSVF